MLTDINKRARMTTGSSVEQLQKGTAVIVWYSGDYSRGMVQKDFDSTRHQTINMHLLDIGVILDTDRSK